MPNNFKLTGDYYVSKFGNDSWDGLTPDTPKRTLQAGLNLITTVNKVLIVGSGVYKEAINKTNIPINGNCTIRADSTVIVEGNGVNEFIIGTNGGAPFCNLDIYGFEFRNYSRVNIFVTNSGTNHRFFNCIFKCNIETTTTNGGGGLYIDSSIFINLNFLLSVLVNTFSITNSILINTNISNISGNLPNIFLNNYINNSTFLGLRSSITAANFNYNNLQGSIVMNVASSVTSGVIQDTYNRYYDLSQAGSGGSGSLSEPYKRGDTILKPFNFSNHRTAYPTMNASSSAVDPKFNSIEDQDFTLQADSWHIGRASDGVSNIGGTKYALRRTSRISFSGSQATVDPSLIFQYDNYIISGSQVTGSITSAPIAVNTATPKVIQKVTYNGLLAFNKDTGSASGSNQNVPDFDTFTSASGNAAANPDRLVYYMRHTTGSSIPVSDAGWDNGGLWTAGQYNVFEWNTKPSIDTSGVGNGSGSFNAAVSPTFIQATYVQMQVKLRNDYLL